MSNRKKPKVKKSQLQILFEKLKIVREWDHIQTRLIEIITPLYENATEEQIDYIDQMICIAENGVVEAAQGIRNNRTATEPLKGLPFEQQLIEVRKENVFAGIVAAIGKLHHIEFFLDPRAQRGVKDKRTKGKYDLRGIPHYVLGAKREEQALRNKRRRENRREFEKLLQQ